MILIVLAAAALLAQAPSQSQGSSLPSDKVQAAASKTAPVQPKTKDDDKVTCQRIASTGSLIAGRECHTNAEWRAMTDETQEDIRETQIRASTPR